MVVLRLHQLNATDLLVWSGSGLNLSWFSPNCKWQRKARIYAPNYI